MFGQRTPVTLGDDLQGALVLNGRFVGAYAAQSIVNVHQLHDARWQGDGFPFKDAVMNRVSLGFSMVLSA